MLAPLHSIAVANWFIEKARDENEKITAMKLQKLIYYAHGWCLALYDKPLVDEQVEAWMYGPVFREVYQSGRSYGSEPITSLLEPMFLEAETVPKSDPRIPLLEKIWEVYGGFTASQLSRMTHEPDGPWDKAWKNGQGRKGTDIPDQLLKDYFKQRMSD